MRARSLPYSISAIAMSVVAVVAAWKGHHVAGALYWIAVALFLHLCEYKERADA